MTTSTLMQIAFAMAILGVVYACSCRPTGAQGTLSMNEFLTGPNSAIMEQRLVVARDAAEWQTLWEAHTRTSIPTPEAPEVDFESDMVVAVFLGQRSSAGYGVAVESCVAADGKLDVVARETQPDPELMQATMMTAPFHWVIVPRAEGEPELRFASDEATD